MHAAYAPSARGSAADETIHVDYQVPLRQLCARMDIDIYNGTVLELFPQQCSRGVVGFRPILHTMPQATAVSIACEMLNSEPATLADLWTLLHCSHLLHGDSKLYSLVPHVQPSDVMQYPYIGRNGRRLYLAMTRDSFMIEQGHSVLRAQKVLVRG